MTNIDAFVAYQNSQKTAAGFNWQLDAPGINPLGESVVGWQSASLPVGHSNAVLLDGPRSQYAVQIDGAGALNILDVSIGQATSGQVVNISGEAYLVFNGGSTSASRLAGVYDQLMIVASGDDATLARMYQSTFGRVPDLAGLEAWTMQLTQHGGKMSLVDVANGFMASAEFSSSFGTGLTDDQFVTKAYDNILGRSPDAAGKSAWLNALANGLSRAQALVGFANSVEEVNHAASWLVDTKAGGYADPGNLLPAATVLDQGEANKYINTNFMAAPSPGQKIYSADAVPVDLGGVNKGLELSIVNGTVVLNTAVNGITFVAGPQVGVITLNGTGNTVIGGGASLFINDWGSPGNNINIGSGPVTILGSFNTVVTGFDPRKDVYQTKLSTLGSIFLDASNGQAVDGNTLGYQSGGANTQSKTPVLKLGDVGSGSAAEVVAVVNKVYHVAGIAAERIAFIGQVTQNSSVASAGDTVIYDFVNFQPGGSFGNPDLNHNGAIDPSELTFEAKLVGLATSTITAHAIGG